MPVTGAAQGCQTSFKYECMDAHTLHATAALSVCRRGREKQETLQCVAPRWRSCWDNGNGCWLGGEGSSKTDETPLENLFDAGTVGRNFPGYSAPPEILRDHPSYPSPLLTGLYHRPQICDSTEKRLPHCHDPETACRLRAALCDSLRTLRYGVVKLADGPLSPNVGVR